MRFCDWVGWRANCSAGLHLVHSDEKSRRPNARRGGVSRRFNDYPGCAVYQKLPKFNVSLCRKNGSDRDLIELPGIAILRPFRSGIQVRIPEIIGSWVRRRRAKVDVRLVARNAVCAPEFDIARASLRRVFRFQHMAGNGPFCGRLLLYRKLWIPQFLLR